MHVSIDWHYVNIRSWAQWDKQLVAPILLSGAIKPLQMKRAQQDDVIKTVPDKPLMVENIVENVMEIWHLCLFQLLFAFFPTFPPRPSVKTFFFFDISRIFFECSAFPSSCFYAQIENVPVSAEIHLCPSHSKTCWHTTTLNNLNYTIINDNILMNSYTLTPA